MAHLDVIDPRRSDEPDLGGDRHTHRRPRADEYRATHLYDLVADPHQRRNLARDPSAASLRAELADRLANAVEAAEGRRPAIAAG